MTNNSTHQTNNISARILLAAQSGDPQQLAAAHDGGHTLPDDWTYSKLGGVLDTISEDGEDGDTGDMVDIYTRDLMAWAGGHTGEVEDYINEYGWAGSLDSAIQGAQAIALDQLRAAVWAELDDICTEYGEGGE